MLAIVIRRLSHGQGVRFGSPAQELHPLRPNLQSGPCVAIVVGPHVRLFQPSDNQNAPAFRKLLATSHHPNSLPK